MPDLEIIRRGPAPAVATAVRLLNALAERPGAATLDELTRAVGEPRSSVHRVLTTLVIEDVLHRSEPRGGYRLGPKLLDWGSSYLRGVDLFDEFRRVAVPIVAELNETVQLAVLDGAEVVHVAKVDSTRQVRLVADVGHRVPAHASAAGKVLLAARPDLAARMRGLPPLTARTITSFAVLRAELDMARAAGFAEETQESSDNLCCVAAPVMSSGPAGPVAAMSICVAAPALDPRYRDSLADCVRNGAAELSRRMGAQLDVHG